MFGVMSRGAGPEIGAEITVHYTPATLPVRMMGGLWDVADHRIAEKAAYPRLAARIGQTFRLVGDTYDTGTHFRFPPSDRMRKGATYTFTPGSGLVALSGAPGIAGNEITFSGGLEVVGFPASTGKKFFGIEVNVAPTAGQTLFLLIGSEASLTPTASNQIAITATGWDIYDAGGTPYTVSGRGAISANDSVIMYRDSATGAWGIIYPDGTDSGDLSGMYGSFTGAGYAGLYYDQAATVTINSDTTALTPPATFSAMSTTGAPSSSSTIGTRGGSSNSAGHTLTIDHLPALQLPITATPTSGGNIGNDTFDIRNASGGGSPAEMTGGNYATLAGGGQAHVHAIEPEYDTVLRLVRVA